VDGRAVGVDDDNYLVLNDQRTYASTLKSRELVHSFSIFFRPGLAEETLGALRQSAESLLAAGGESPAKSVEFAEHLHPHDRLVTPLLRYISSQVDAGLEDEMWYEEQFSYLMERLLRVHHEDLAAIDALGMVRAATRREIRRRIGWSTDFIHTYYMRPLDMKDLARAATLSRYHFIRLFRAIHGMTPFAYLQRKRAAVAARLLRSTGLGQDMIARRVGFESRSTMFRHLRRHAGAGGRSLPAVCEAVLVLAAVFGVEEGNPGLSAVFRDLDELAHAVRRLARQRGAVVDEDARRAAGIAPLEADLRGRGQLAHLGLLLRAAGQQRLLRHPNLFPAVGAAVVPEKADAGAALHVEPVLGEGAAAEDRVDVVLAGGPTARGYVPMAEPEVERVQSRLFAAAGAGRC
jgi:AraC family transcriptional regulator